MWGGRREFFSEMNVAPNVVDNFLKYMFLIIMLTILNQGLELLQ